MNDYNRELCEAINYLTGFYKNKRDYDEDFVQDVAIRAIELQHKYNESCSVKTWVFGIAKFMKMSKRRDDKRRKLICVPLIESDSHTHQNHEHDKEIILKCISELTPHQIDAIVNSIYGYKVYEVSNRRDKTQGYIKSDLYRIRGLLRHKLAKIGIL